MTISSSDLAEVNSVIVTCTCRDTPRFAQDAFRILFPDFNAPILLTGRQIIELAEQFPGTDFSEYLMALSHNKEKYARLFFYTDEGKVLSQYNLITGATVC